MKDGQKPLHDMIKLVAHPVGSGTNLVNDKLI